MSKAGRRTRRHRRSEAQAPAFTVADYYRWHLTAGHGRPGHRPTYPDFQEWARSAAL